jgi:hypothetical protein
MEYLAENLDNSKTLCYDILRDIYEYADPLRYIRRDINNKNYDLDEIMYKRMKKFINKKFDEGLGMYYISTFKSLNGYWITPENINDPIYKNDLIHSYNGYKQFFLWKHKRHTHICGLEPNFPLWYNMQMIGSIEKTYPNSCVNYYIKPLPEIYELWKNL